MKGPCNHCGKETDRWGLWDGHDPKTDEPTHGTFFDCGCTDPKQTLLGEVMRKTRINLEISLRDAATKSNIPVVTLSGYERGRGYPTGDEIRAIAEAIGAIPEAWLGVADGEKEAQS